MSCRVAFYEDDAPDKMTEGRTVDETNLGTPHRPGSVATTTSEPEW
jgi:hypothetical protein